MMREVWGTVRCRGSAAVLSPGRPRSSPGSEIRHEDVENRRVGDRQRCAEPAYDNQDIVAVTDKFALRFAYTAKAVGTGEPVSAEVNHIYHLRAARIGAFWLPAEVDFDYRA
jgi:hypothetical protein